MNVRAGVHIVFYVLFVRIVKVVTTRVAEVVRAEMATAEDVAVGRFESDVTGVIFWGYLQCKS